MNSVAGIAEAVVAGRRTAELGARETATHLERVEREGLNATLHWSPSSSLPKGSVPTRPSVPQRPAGARPLAGVPVVLKDNIVTTEQPTTCGSRILEGYVSPFEATAVRRLRDAGALVAGKTNMDEFAMGSSTEHSAYGPVRHPLDPDARARRLLRRLGRAGGGRRRSRWRWAPRPAARCASRPRSAASWAVKPTYGRVSRYGLVAFGSSLDQHRRLRPERRRCRGAVLAAISGHDPYDATTARLPPLELGPARTDLKGLTVIGVPQEYFPADLRRRCPRGAAIAPSSGSRRWAAEVRDVSLPAHEVRGAHLLHRRARRGGVEPRALRRRAVRPRRSRGPAATCARSTRRRAARASAPRCGAASCSAPTC